MKFNCPGRLYAKSFFEKGEIIKDYEEWFAHPNILAWHEISDGFRLDLKSGPVVVVVKLSADCNLLIRYSWSAVSDLNGRRHSRREEFLVTDEQCTSMLAGRFVASPDKAASRFTIETGTENKLHEVARDKIDGRALAIYARNRDDFDFAKKQKTAHSEQSDECVHTTKPQRECFMFKFLFIVLACGCLTGGWYCWSTCRELEHLKLELENVKAELKDCRNRNRQLQRWTDNRQNFERNISDMQEVFATIEKALKHGQFLLQNRDGNASKQTQCTRMVVPQKNINKQKQGAVTNSSQKATSSDSPSENKKAQASRERTHTVK